MKSWPAASTVFPYTTLFRSPVYRLAVGTGAEIQGAKQRFQIWNGGQLRWQIGILVRMVNDGLGVGTMQIKAVVSDPLQHLGIDRKSTRLNSSHSSISYAVFC